MPDVCSINQYFCVTQYVSDLMSIFDPNNTQVCLLELWHLWRCIITDVRMRHEPLPDDATRKMTTNKPNR